MSPSSPAATGSGARTRGALLLADISGYTGFLQGVADAHRALVVEADEPPAAYALMSSLLDRIVASLEPRFRLVKFEGDAVFATSSGSLGELRGVDVLGCLEACYLTFAEGLAQAGKIWTCSCDACSRAGSLDLKFVLHVGDYVVQRIAGREELLGPDVNTVHRLLKNGVRELIGPQPYALITDDALAALGIAHQGMVAIREAYDDTPAVDAHVLAMR